VAKKRATLWRCRAEGYSRGCWASVLRCSGSKHVDGDPGGPLPHRLARYLPHAFTVGPSPPTNPVSPPSALWAPRWRGPVKNLRRWALAVAGAWPRNLSAVLGKASAGGTPWDSPPQMLRKQAHAGGDLAGPLSFVGDISPHQARYLPRATHEGPDKRE